MAIRRVSKWRTTIKVQLMERPQVYVCTPVYYSGPEVPRVLDELLASVEQQDYPQHRIHKCLSLQQCPDLGSYVEIVRVLNKKRGTGMSRGVNCIMQQDNIQGPAMNTNEALSWARNAKGYVKIMNQDDLLDSPSAISDMVDALEGSDAKWLASACQHTDSLGVKRERLHVPFWPGEKAMVEGVNRIGCPSVVMFDAELQLECDVDVLYAMDCDMWIQLFRQAGPPLIHQSPDVVVRMWENQLTENLDIPRQLEADKAAMRKKYGYV